MFYHYNIYVCIYTLCVLACTYCTRKIIYSGTLDFIKTLFFGSVLKVSGVFAVSFFFKIIKYAYYNHTPIYYIKILSATCTPSHQPHKTRVVNITCTFTNFVLGDRKVGNQILIIFIIVVYFITCILYLR